MITYLSSVGLSSAFTFSNGWRVVIHYLATGLNEIVIIPTWLIEYNGATNIPDDVAAAFERRAMIARGDLWENVASDKTVVNILASVCVRDEALMQPSVKDMLDKALRRQ